VWFAARACHDRCVYVCVFTSPHFITYTDSVKRRLIEAGAGSILDSLVAHYADNEAVLPVVTAARAELGV
jgi:hypothetical protein